MGFIKYFVIVSLGILILLIGLEYAIYSNVKEQTIQNANNSQIIQAQQTAAGIQDYFNSIISTIESFTHQPAIINFSKKGKQKLLKYQLANSDKILSITRVSSNNKIIYTVPDRGVVGKDLSSQAHIKFVSKTHKTVISDVFKAVQGFRTIAVHVPVFNKGTYDGTLAFLLSFNKIAKKFIENIHIGKKGYAWVISQKGIEISSPYPGHIGKSVYEIYKNYPDIIYLIDKVLKGKQGEATYRYKNIGSRTTGDITRLAVYMPIQIINTHWYLIISTPEKEVLGYLTGLRTKLILISIALLLAYVISIYFIVSSQIITHEQKKRKNVLAALRESESRYKTLFEQNPAPTLIYELGTFNMLAVNDAFLHHYGYTQNEILNMKLLDLYPEAQKEELVKMVSGIKGYKNVGEWRHRKKNGSFIDIVASSNDLIYQGTKARIAVITDVTERKITEKRFFMMNVELEKRVAERTAELEIEKEKAESADQLKSAFLATMSHELRTPLNSIIGFTGILMKGIAGPLNKEQLKQLGMARGSAQHLLELINDVLDISKIEAGQLEVTYKKFDFIKLLQKVIDTVKPLADKKSLALYFDSSITSKEINCDERRAGQIFINLLNNAIKFTEKGYVKVECGTEDNKIIARVKDTGEGIKKEDMNKLFKPFSQIDTGLTRNHEGTGLGLSICQKLVDKLGGTITVESVLNEGSVFTVALPL